MESVSTNQFYVKLCIVFEQLQLHHSLQAHDGFYGRFEKWKRLGKNTVF